MSTQPNLTPDAIRLIVTDEDKTTDPSFQPVLQVMNVKKLSAAPGAQDRFRVILSDGVHYMQGMLASQLTTLVHDGRLVADCLIRLKSYMRNTVQNMTICIALDMEIVTPSAPRVGNPVLYGGGPAAANTATTAPAAAAPLYNSTNGHAAPGSHAGAAAHKPPTVSPAHNPYGQRSSSSPANKHAVPNRYASSSSSSTPIARSAPGAVTSMFTRIADLNMYQNRWTIRARLVSKSDIRTWSNAKGEGRLFSVELQDESSDIRATFFKEAVDKFYNVLQVSQVYTFTGGRLKVANLQYNTCQSQHEITFDQNSEVHLDTSADAKRLAAPLYDFCKIANIANVPDKQFVDVLGLVRSVGDVTTILSKKSGREMTKLDVTLVDDSAAQISLTFWGQSATDAARELTPEASILAVRRARVSDYNGKSLSGIQSHQVAALPQLETVWRDQPAVLDQARAIAQWWQQTQGAGGSGNIQTLSTGRSSGGSRPTLAEIKPLASIRQDHLGTSGAAADYISVKAEVSFLKKDKEGGAWYTACPNAGEPCQNRYKVTPTTDGQFHCEKCGNYYPNCTRRWIFSALLEDVSSSTWVSFFNDQAETLLDGTTADQVFEATNQMDGSAADTYEGYFAKALHSEWVFRCKVKQEIVNDEPRTKTSVVGMFPVDYVQDAKAMLAALQVS